MPYASPEKRKEQQKRYYEEHKEKLNAGRAERYRIQRQKKLLEAQQASISVEN